MEKDEEKIQTKEEKVVGAVVSYFCNDELQFKLKRLSDYVTNNGIKVDRYYTAGDGELVPYYELLADIFEENIDTLVVVGHIDNLPIKDETIDKILQYIDVINI